ncbi:MAG: hypothetical protein K2K21_16585 [Lachnospiraceae bacterium]|nr:hypothetical protein [Lachnospiraceae bacterium]
MKKCFWIICVLLCILQWGCGTDDGQTESILEQDISGQNMPEQSISASVTGEDPAEIQTVSEDSYVLLPDQAVTYGDDPTVSRRQGNSFWMPENILNYEEVIKDMVIAHPRDRERIVAAFCDTFPEELQEAYKYEIEHYREVDVHFAEYNTGLEWHAIEEFPYEIPSGLSYGVNIAYTEDNEFSYQEVDLDEDGEMEYLFKKDHPWILDDTYYRVGYVYKIVDGEPVLCFCQPLGELGMESLYYEGDYYLYMGWSLVRCGEGCDLLSRRYEEDKTYYTLGYNLLENSYLEYIVADKENGDYTWHEGYRLEGYEGIDFKAYLPDGLENHLPKMCVHNGIGWDFEAASRGAGGKGGYIFARYSLPVEVDGVEYEYLFLRREGDHMDRDVIAAVIKPEEDGKYTAVCMYSLIYTDVFSLIDEREYKDEMVVAYRLAADCVRGRIQNDSYEALMEAYHPYRVERIGGDYYNSAKQILFLYYEMDGEERRMAVKINGEEFETIYEGTGVKFMAAFVYPGVLEHTLDEETGTESYLYYEIRDDIYNTGVFLKDSFIRVDEDRDGIFTEADSYYCNGYELDPYTWECWISLYLSVEEGYGY